MDRRKAIINLSLTAAGLGFSSAFISALTSCESAPVLDYQPLVFTAEEDLLVQTLTELIIPTTSTPGAKAAQVNQYIDRVFGLVKDAEEKELFLAGVRTLGKPFLKLSETEQIARLTELEKESEQSDGPHFFSVLKSMTIYGYYTSEIGASQELAYVHMAGTYRGDVPYSEIGRTYY